MEFVFDTVEALFSMMLIVEVGGDPQHSPRPPFDEEGDVVADPPSRNERKAPATVTDACLLFMVGAPSGFSFATRFGSDELLFRSTEGAAEEAEVPAEEEELQGF